MHLSRHEIPLLDPTLTDPTVRYVPLVSRPTDSDGDGTPDVIDNCPFDSNANQARFADSFQLISMRTAADAVETVDLHAPDMLDEVQPIVSLSE